MRYRLSGVRGRSPNFRPRTFRKILKIVSRDKTGFADPFDSEGFASRTNFFGGALRGRTFSGPRVGATPDRNLAN
jgi:hypothetical protein